MDAVIVDDEQNWRAVASLFKLDPAYCYLDTFSLSTHPAPVREAIEYFRDRLDAGAECYVMEQGPKIEADVVAAAARYLAVPPEEIALTDSTTMGLGIVYGGMLLGPGDEIVTTTHDYYACTEALRLREAAGVVVRRVALYENAFEADPDEMVRRLCDAISDRTQLVAITWVHSGTGVKLPVQRMCAAMAELNRYRAEERKILVSVDATHAFGVETSNAGDLGCDFFASSTHKWLFGPRGTGVVWGTTPAWSRVVPTIPTFDRQTRRARVHGRAHVTPPGAFMTPGGYHSFEHRWALTAAFELHTRIGRERVCARVRELSARAKDGLAKMPHVQLATPIDPELSSGLVCFDVNGYPASEVASYLRHRHIIASVTPYATEHVRLGPTLANLEPDIDRVLDAIDGLK